MIAPIPPTYPVPQSGLSLIVLSIFAGVDALLAVGLSSEILPTVAVSAVLGVSVAVQTGLGFYLMHRSVPRAQVVAVESPLTAKIVAGPASALPTGEPIPDHTRALDIAPA